MKSPRYALAGGCTQNYDELLSHATAVTKDPQEQGEKLMAQMSEELIEQWADATAEIYNESLSGLNLSRLPEAVAQYIDLFAQSEDLVFNEQSSPTDFFEKHPFLAVTAILNSPEAVEVLDSDAQDALDDMADFCEAWFAFDREQEPELGVSEADDEEGW